MDPSPYHRFLLPVACTLALATWSSVADAQSTDSPEAAASQTQTGAPTATHLARATGGPTRHRRSRADDSGEQAGPQVPTARQLAEATDAGALPTFRVPNIVVFGLIDPVLPPPNPAMPPPMPPELRERPSADAHNPRLPTPTRLLLGPRRLVDQIVWEARGVTNRLERLGQRVMRGARLIGPPPERATPHSDRALRAHVAPGWPGGPVARLRLTF